MNKRFLKKVLATGAAAAVLAPLAVLAQVPDASDPRFTNLATEFNLGTETNVEQVIINIVKILLGFLGLIAVLIVLYGGFQWMTAAGNEEKVSSARATLTAGLIGLIIILSAYAIATFVISTYINQGLGGGAT